MKNGVVKKAYSKILNKKVDIWVLCPQEPKALLYMMHGNGGDCLEWSENTDLVQQAQACGLPHSGKFCGSRSCRSGRIHSLLWFL